MRRIMTWNEIVTDNLGTLCCYIEHDLDDIGVDNVDERCICTL